MRDNKLVLPYKDEEGVIQPEIVEAEKEGKYYRILGIPVHVTGVSKHDLIRTRFRGGLHYFHKIIEGSGRSVIQVAYFNDLHLKTIEKGLEQFGCTGVCYAGQYVLAFDIPKHVPYEPIKRWLDEGEKQRLWGYREASMSHGSFRPTGTKTLKN